MMFCKQSLSGVAVLLLAVVNCSREGCMLSEEVKDVMGRGNGGVVFFVDPSGKETTEINLTIMLNARILCKTEYHKIFYMKLIMHIA